MGLGSLEWIGLGNSGGVDVGPLVGRGGLLQGGADLTAAGGLGGNLTALVGSSLRSHRMVRFCSREHGVEIKSVSTWIRNIPDQLRALNLATMVS